MPRLVITPQDVKRSTVLDAGWFPVEVTEVREEPSSKGDSKNIIIDLVGLVSNDPEKNKGAGVPLRRYFSEKAPGFATNFILSCGVKVGDDGGEFELSNAVGKKMEAYVKPRMFEGSLRNDVADFRPLGG